MKLFDAIVTGAKLVAPVAAGFGLGGPVGAVLTLTGQAAGAVEKMRGKRAEAGGAKPIHKGTAPVAAVAAPTALAAGLTALGVDGGDRIAEIACSSPEALGAAYGMLAIVVHQLTSGLTTAARGRG